MKTRICQVMVGLVVFSSFLLWADEADPSILLQGLRSSREQIPPTRLHLRASYKNPFYQAAPEFEIVFDGRRRLFSQTNAGANLKMMFNGTNVMRYDGVGYAIIRDLDTQTADFLFDPRLLGITTSYAWDDRSLYDLMGQDIELQGREKIAERDVWRVRMSNNNIGHSLILWVDDKTNFSVCQAEERFEKFGHRVVRATYDPSLHSILPARIKTEEFDINGAVVLERDIEIISVDSDIALPENFWSMDTLFSGAMKLPEMIPITDVRSQEIIGYWKDAQFWPGKSPPAPVPTAPAPSPARNATILAVVFLAVLPIPVIWYLRRKGGE